MAAMFNVGDIVHIVKQPREIPSSWVGPMNVCCGHEVKIISYVCYNDHTSYHVRPVDGSDYLDFMWDWNDEAFQEFYGEYAPEIEESQLLNILEA